MLDFAGIWLQVATIWLLFLVAFTAAAYRDRRVPADDIGLVVLLALAIYNSLPAIVWILQDGHYTSELTGRLIHLQPVVDEVAYLLALVIGYAAGFALVFAPLRLRSVRPAPGTHWGRVPSGALVLALALVVVNAAFVLSLSLLGVVGQVQSYADEYRVIAELPLPLRQAKKLLAGFAGFSTLVLLVGIVQRGRPYRKWIAVYVALLLVSFDPAGSRAGLVLAMGSVVIAWHVLVRPIHAPAWLAMAAVGLVGFTLSGLLRSTGGWDNLQSARAHELISLGEFESLWANGVELLQTARWVGLDVPWHARFAEFFAFVPSQLLPFEKMSLDQWYLQRFHADYAAAGGGLAFGAVPQAIIGAGVAEAVLRGTMLAFAALLLLNVARRRHRHWLALPVYLYLLINAYTAVRSSTFAQLSDLVQVVLPCALLLWAGNRLLIHASGRLPAHASHPPRHPHP